MVKVSIDDSIWEDPRLIALAAAMGWDRSTALGKLILLWHRTRREGVEALEPDALLAYVPGTPEMRRETLRALLKSGFVRAEGTRLVLAGNAEHFSLIRKRRAAGAKGRAQTTLVGKARLAAREKAKAKKRPKLAPKPKSTALVKETEAQAANRAAWEAYRLAYLALYQVEPTRNARTNAWIKQIVERIGRGDAPEVLRFFVSHTDALYVRGRHTLNLALRDIEGLHTQYRRRESPGGEVGPLFEAQRQIAAVRSGIL